MDYLWGDTNLFIREFHKKLSEILGFSFWGLHRPFFNGSWEQECSRDSLEDAAIIKSVAITPLALPLNPCLKFCLRSRAKMWQNSKVKWDLDLSPFTTPFNVIKKLCTKTSLEVPSGCWSQPNNIVTVIEMGTRHYQRKNCTRWCRSTLKILFRHHLRWLYFENVLKKDITHVKAKPKLNCVNFIVKNMEIFYTPNFARFFCPPTFFKSFRHGS